MITSRQNERLKDIRRLLQCKDTPRKDTLRACGQVRAVLEGPHLIREALAAGLTLTDLLMTAEFAASSAAEELLPQLPRPPLQVATPLLDELADSDSPRGILAVVQLPRHNAADLTKNPDGVYVFAEAVQNPGNLGALARTAEASGVSVLVLGPGCAKAHHPRALRGSAGSLLRLPTVRLDLPQLEAHLDDLAPRYLALVPRQGGDLYTAPLSRGAIVLLLGSEGRGLSPSTLDRADLPLTIPMAAPVESLNATVAASLVLFEIQRQRRGS